MNWIISQLDKNWLYYTVASFVIYFLVFFTVLFIDESINTVTFSTIIFSIALLFLVSILFRLISVRIWINLLYSFSVPLAILIALYVEKLPGLGKAQIHEKAIIFFLLWIILFALFYAITFLIKKLRN
jgi:hypothetical protein